MKGEFVIEYALVLKGYQRHFFFITAYLCLLQIIKIHCKLSEWLKRGLQRL